jgi:hypothetical protein
VDLMSYWLQSEYARWVHDPDDPETKAAERERRRSGVKPPPEPIVPPVAHRPPTVAANYRDQYLQRVAELAPPKPVKELVSSDTWDRALGLA